MKIHPALFLIPATLLALAALDLQLLGFTRAAVVVTALAEALRRYAPELLQSMAAVRKWDLIAGLLASLVLHVLAADVYLLYRSSVTE